MKKIIIIITIVICVLNSFAQKKPSIKFKETSHTFGSIKQEAGSVKTVFTFSNEGNDTLKLIYVKPSCGCTSVKYPVDPILPGKKGEIETVYDAAKHPGDFKKSIIVRTNDPEQETVLLYIQGYVVPTGKSIAERKYPQPYGNLKFINNHLTLDTVRNNEVKTSKLSLFNSWGKTMKIEFKNIPEWITIKPISLKIKSQKEAEVQVMYDGKKRNDLGLVFDKISIVTNDTSMPEKVVYISAEIVEDFTKLTPEQLINSPKISFKTTEYNFPDAITGDKINYSFEFTNTGKSDLIIRKVKAGCGCISTFIDKTILKPGEKTSIKAVFDTHGWIGDQHKTINVICNDPKQTEIILSIIGKVNKAQ